MILSHVKSFEWGHKHSKLQQWRELCGEKKVIMHYDVDVSILSD